MGNLAASIAPFLEIFGGLRDGELGPRSPELDLAPRRMADTIKGSGYFLDAAMMGVCRVPKSAWLPVAIACTSASSTSR